MAVRWFSVFIVTFLLQATKCLSQQDAFTILPTNTHGTRGENVTLHCALSNGSFALSWMNPDRLTVYEKGFGITPGLERDYDVEIGNENRYSLIIINAAPGDAGRYTCHCWTVASSASAEVILLDPLGVQCTETSPSGNYSDSVEGEQITLECQIGFFGLWGPTQNWTDNQGKILAPTDLSTVGTVRYVNTDGLRRNDSGLRWIVDSYFPLPPNGTIPDDVTTPPIAYYSRSAPTWNEVYVSAEVFVYYPVDSMVLRNVKDVYAVGEAITCLAEGNPEPDISWLDEQNTTLSDSGTLLIQEPMTGLQTFICLATNVVRGKTSKVSQNITAYILGVHNSTERVSTTPRTWTPTIEETTETSHSSSKQTGLPSTTATTQESQTDVTDEMTTVAESGAGTILVDFAIVGTLFSVRMTHYLYDTM